MKRWSVHAVCTSIHLWSSLRPRVLEMDKELQRRSLSSRQRRHSDHGSENSWRRPEEREPSSRYTHSHDTHAPARRVKMRRHWDSRSRNFKCAHGEKRKGSSSVGALKDISWRLQDVMLYILGGLSYLFRHIKTCYFKIHYILLCARKKCME